ncbi:YraN family protein [uncultured Pseudosulfitobacter sp.]|uniref:YraN family protein n=1 Tax=uncultured Pseudosulfitobacter sp. TaxID=2854214 RepID=UPI0030DD91A6|tara:strand:+ start:14081 stop:14536 length:456 start_codon:yes stop_codon:yes gene_type:complete
MDQLAFDFSPIPAVAAAAVAVPAARPAATDRRRLRGAMAYQAGASAEMRISSDYERRGFPVVQQRWRGKRGEIDLIAQDGDGLVFIEVKQSKTFDRAAARLTAAQMRRIYASAEEYLGRMPRGSLTEVRFDVALVNGQGETRIIENAFGLD